MTRVILADLMVGVGPSLSWISQKFPVLVGSKIYFRKNIGLWSTLGFFNFKIGPNYLVLDRSVLVSGSMTMSHPDFQID